MMPIQSLPCGCRHQGPQWVELCPGHRDASWQKRQSELAARREAEAAAATPVPPDNSDLL